MTQRWESIHQLLDKFKPDCQVMPHFPFQNLLACSVGLGAGVTGLCWLLHDGYFRAPLPSEQRKSSIVSLMTVAGLLNLGNNCFLNSILQSLASSRCFLPYLQKFLVLDNVGDKHKAENFPLMVSLTSLLEVFRMHSWDEDDLVASAWNLYFYLKFMKKSHRPFDRNLLQAHHFEWLGDIQMLAKFSELCLVRDEKIVVNPRIVMLAMAQYIPGFNLTRQQDAAEAFIHLMSSLEKEIIDQYINLQHCGSLADITSFSSRIYSQKKGESNEFDKWKEIFMGPFDGIIGSYLICQSCLSILSVDLEFFRSLPLSPVLDGLSDIVEGCTIFDCLKHFTKVEHVDNYRCGRCWHRAALKHLSCRPRKDEVNIRRLSHCVNLDSCDCKAMLHGEEFSSTSLSHALKKLSIVRFPKVLSFHLKRASMNWHGELIKLQGHVAFPMLLDLSPFMEVATFGQLNLIKYTRNNIQMLPQLYRIINQTPSVSASESKFEVPFHELLESKLPEPTAGNSSDKAAPTEMISGFHQFCSIQEQGDSEKKVEISGSRPSKSCLYYLCSVVEHYGRPGSGHYSVYRKVACPPSSSGSNLGSPEFMSGSWVSISDSKVRRVSEEDVLGAEASILFFEKVEDDQ